jgi:hypothetical protein
MFTVTINSDLTFGWSEGDAFGGGNQYIPMNDGFVYQRYGNGALQVEQIKRVGTLAELDATPTLIAERSYAVDFFTHDEYLAQSGDHLHAVRWGDNGDWKVDVTDGTWELTGPVPSEQWVPFVDNRTDPSIVAFNPPEDLIERFGGTVIVPWTSGLESRRVASPYGIVAIDSASLEASDWETCKVAYVTADETILSDFLLPIYEINWASWVPVSEGAIGVVATGVSEVYDDVAGGYVRSSHAALYLDAPAPVIGYVDDGVRRIFAR